MKTGCCLLNLTFTSGYHITMRKTKSLFIVYSLFFIFFNLLFAPAVHAVCPVCTIAVGAGLGISRALGIDDAVTSIWIGGLILSMSFWAIDWMEKKEFKAIDRLRDQVKKRYFDLVIIFLFYVI